MNILVLTRREGAGRIYGNQVRVYEMTEADIMDGKAEGLSFDAVVLENATWGQIPAVVARRIAGSRDLTQAVATAWVPVDLPADA